MNKAMCYLCLAVDGRHTAECRATEEYTVPLDQGASWRLGVKAAHDVTQFLPDVAYMPVPRCDQCAHWERYGEADNEQIGKCFVHAKTAYSCRSGLKTHESFGCVEHKAKP